MVDLATWANIAEIVGGLTVLVGLLYAAVEFRRTRQERQDAAALEIVRAGQTPTFTKAIDVLYRTPVVDERLFREDPSVRDAVSDMWTYYETIGYLVYKGVVPLHMFDEFGGGGLRLLWGRCKDWVEEVRQDPARRHAFEWVQWLYDQVERDPAAGKDVGAHIAHADWRPK